MLKDTSNKSDAVVKKNIFWQYLLQIAVYIFPFITLPFLTRVLGPDEFAVRAYSVSILSLITVLIDFGFNPFGTREIARHRDDLPYMKKLTTTILAQRCILAIAGAGILLAIIPTIPIMANNPEYMMIAYAGTVLTALLPDFVFRGLEDMSILTKRFVVSRLVSLVLIFCFIRSADQLVLVAVFEAVPALIAFIWSWIAVARKFKIVPNLKLIDLRESLTIFKTSFVFFLSSAATTIFTNLTTVMIGIYIVNQAEISYWSLATTVIAAVQSLYNPIYNSIYPHVAATRNFAIVKKYLLLGMPVVFIGSIALYFLAPFAMLLLGGSEYLEGSLILQILIPVLVLSYPAIIIGFPILAVINKEKLLTASSVVAALFQIAGLFVLASLGCFTLVNVAILRCITELIMMVLRVAFVARSRHLLSAN